MSSLPLVPKSLFRHTEERPLVTEIIAVTHNDGEAEATRGGTAVAFFCLVCLLLFVLVNAFYFGFF